MMSIIKFGFYCCVYLGAAASFLIAGAVVVMADFTTQGETGMLVSVHHLNPIVQILAILISPFVGAFIGGGIYCFAMVEIALILLRFAIQFFAHSLVP